MKTVIVELTNRNALKLLQQLEDLDLIRLKKEKPIKQKLSEKYRGILSKKEGESLNKHINKMRYEWSS